MNFIPHYDNEFDVAVKQHHLPLVYAVTTPGLEFVKIGYSGSFESRLESLQSGNPMLLSLWLGIRTPKPVIVETYLHDMFFHCWRRGEWFEPGIQEIDAMIDIFTGTNQHIKEVSRALLQA